MNATLEATVSVGRSVGLSRQVTFLKYGSNLHFKGTLGYLGVLKSSEIDFSHLRSLKSPLKLF